MAKQISRNYFSNNVFHFCHNVFLHWLRLYGCGSVAGGGRATIKELSDQSGVNCLARWSKYSAQDQDHNIPDQYTRAIYKTNIQDQYTRPVFKTNIQDQDQDQDHERTMRPKWGQLPGQVVQILCPRPRPQYTRPIYKSNIQDQYTRPIYKTSIQDQYTRPRPRPRPWKNYETKVGSTAWPGGPNTLSKTKTTIYKTNVQDQYTRPIYKTRTKTKTMKELSDQSGINCLAWSKYSAQDHNLHKDLSHCSI